MKRKDDLLLESLYQEGIWDRLQGQGAGLKRGAGTLLQKAGAKIAGQEAPQKSARGEYAKAQQTSLLNSFKKKVDKEIADFNNDLKSFKVNPDPSQLEKDFPIIAQRLKEIENLKNYLSNPTEYSKPSETDLFVEPTKKPEETTVSSPETQITASQPTEAKPDAEQANKEFLAARDTGEVSEPTPTEQPAEEQPTPTPKEEPKPEISTPVEEPIKPIQPFKYTNGKTYGRDEQGWYQYFPKARFKKKRVSQKSSDVLNAYLQEKEPTGSSKQGERAAKAGFRTPAEQKAATTIGDSYNPFAEFLKGYELI